MATLTDHHSSLTHQDMLRWAQEAGAPSVALQRAMETHSWLHVVQADRSLAGRLMVRATPTMFINGRRMDGLESEALLAEVIDKERVAARKRSGNLQRDLSRCGSERPSVAPSCRYRRVSICTPRFRLSSHLRRAVSRWSA